MTPRILVLGGGSGGLLVVDQLWRKLRKGEAEIVLVDKRDKHLFQAELPWVAFGYRELEDITVSLEAIAAKRGIKFVQAEVERIDPANRRVSTDKGELEYDYLVVALGVEPDYSAIPGLEAETLAPWTIDASLKLREKIREFKKGVIVSGFAKSPFLCPPAPYEVAGQARCVMNRKGLVDVEIKVAVPELKPLYLMSPAISDTLLESLTQVNIEFIGGFEYDYIDAKEKIIVGKNGERIKYDLLLVVPPYKPSKPVAESDLAGQGGWMTVNPLKGFRSTKYDDVYGIGDIVAPPLNLPMAGVVAHAESGVLTTAIISDIRGAMLGYGLNLYAACAMDMGHTGILPFCDFTPAVLGYGPPYCGRIFEGAAVKIMKELFETYWFTQVAPKD